MYLQIGLKKEDRPFHRFLWKSDKEPPEEYEFNRVVFGVNASPYIAQFVSRKNANIFKAEFPAAAETVLKSTYMDDSMDSVMSDELGVQLYKELSALWKNAGMIAKKWLSNSAAVLEIIPKEDLASEVDLDSGSLPTKKVLGVFWIASTDEFTFRGSNIHETKSYTKRYVLKVVARLFDPIGFLSPFIIQGKQLLQKLWLDGYDWDDSVNPDMKQNINKWFNSISELKEIRISRCLNFNADMTRSSIHVFTDASELAYASVIYVRHELENSIDVQFICSKTRVAPLKAVSIPRLELMAAVLGVRLVHTVIEALQLSIDQVQFWTDSSDVIWWIHRESRCFKPFVANRVGEIHELSQPKQWRYVPSSENPADLASRGTSASVLCQAVLWWTGPEFLKKSEEEWPRNIQTDSDRTVSEKRTKSHKDDSFQVFFTMEQAGNILKPENYSDWIRLTRIVAWLIRFTHNVRSRQKRTSSAELQADEIKTAENFLIQQTQKEKYSLEYKCLASKQLLPAKSSLLKLNPKIDENGILRSDSRLINAELLSYDAKFPVILPRKSWVTKLIVKYHHEMNNHSGTNQTLASLSSKFWIEGAREEIREWEQECAYCKKQKRLPSKQIMAPLPKFRTNVPLRPFAHTAVDFAGPYITIQGRGKRREKRYLCLFTCLGCRAVHLEMAYGLDTNTFLNAFTRFTSRRGVPVLMNSDNGTNFVGADRELKELVSALETDKIVRETAYKGIEWIFNPPAAPHFGGVHEALIKSAKRAIGKILYNADINDEELLTAIVGAEGLLNSRPLTYQSANPSDDVVLTPNHFLHGQLGGNFAPDTVEVSPHDPRKRWRYVQQLVKHIWRRWLREFMPTLSGRRKWFHMKHDFKKGDVVIVLDPESPKGQWPLGIIVETFPGNDGHVRVVSVRVGQNILRRPISKMCFLEHSRLYEQDFIKK